MRPELGWWLLVSIGEVDAQGGGGRSVPCRRGGLESEIHGGVSDQGTVDADMACASVAAEESGGEIDCTREVLLER